MTRREALFVEEYLSCFNATKAAIAAGYSPKTARTIGAQNLTKVDIASAISQRLKETAMSADEVMMRLAAQARGSMAQFLNVNDDGKASLDFKNARDTGSLDLVKKVTETTRTYKDETTTVLSIELYDAQAALQLIGKHHKLFTEKMELDDAGLSDDQRATRIIALLDKARARRDGSPLVEIEDGDLEAAAGATDRSLLQ